MLDVPTSTQQTDGAQEPRLSIVHLQRQQLVGESKHEVRQRPEAGVVHLSAVQRQPIRERHGVLVGGVPRADPQNLSGRRKKIKQKQKNMSELHI